jgi:hypothetical protein
MFHAIEAQTILSKWDIRKGNIITMMELVKIIPNIRNFIIYFYYVPVHKECPFFIIIEIKACEKS